MSEPTPAAGAPSPAPAASESEGDQSPQAASAAFAAETGPAPRLRREILLGVVSALIGLCLITPIAGILYVKVEKANLEKRRRTLCRSLVEEIQEEFQRTCKGQGGTYDFNTRVCDLPQGHAVRFLYRDPCAEPSVRPTSP